MLRNRHFLLLWLVTVITTLGVELFAVTVLVAVFEQTSSTLQATGVMVARFLPAFVLGPVAGVLVDRFPRKNVLISMDVLRLLLIFLAIWLLGQNEQVPIISMYLILVGLSSAEVFHQPARLALIPSLVLPSTLVQANSFMMVSRQIAMATSYTIGGWLVLNFTLIQISWGVISLFGISILGGILLSVPRRLDEAEEAERESVWRAFLSGWNYLRAHPVARPLTIMETVEHLPHGIWTSAILLAFTFQALQGDASDWGYQVTGYFSGMIVGSLIALSTSKWLRKYPGWIIVINACGSGIMTLIYAGSQTVWFAVAMAFIFGPPFAIRDVAQDALLQGTVAENQLGRVYATREMLRNIVFVFAGILFAWLSDLISIRIIYVIGGILYLLTGVYALSNKSLRESKMEPERENSDREPSKEQTVHQQI